MLVEIGMLLMVQYTKESAKYEQDVSAMATETLKRQMRQ